MQRWLGAGRRVVFPEHDKELSRAKWELWLVIGRQDALECGWPAAQNPALLYLFVSGRLWSGATVTGSEKAGSGETEMGDVFVVLL